ncbi:MAG: crossover junction endodeoxyribonuclease RuvC [Candidatus Sericytochromatia bacterium]|uniref:Crossover junction endodeoxyribonuclease RuvC n=1 Tax=Candidatus Tanganyikabacteria bacterium TaxID=2961651 RepID=A0A937X532_9BACT|nr:crossover junction endodeoxyribonuclease RuvC [Candidatus Tanganyikabacteria bacterium]
MRILGVDPGTATVGYGLVDAGVDWQARIVTAGVITTSKALTLQHRLHEIHTDLSALIAQYRPDCVAVEELFFVRNITNGIGVAMSRGVILLAAAQAGLEVAGYVPMVVKQTVVGHGRAEKREVQETVRDLLALDRLPKPDDAADGLAIALCHLRHLEVGDALAATI